MPRTKEERQAYIKEWKRKKREALGIPPRGQKKHCRHGHPYPENRRPGRPDCAICHRQQELTRKRNKGVKPKVIPDYCPQGHPRDQRRPNRNDCAICHRISFYGITGAEYQDLLNRYADGCGICKRKVTLGIDHDHRTGKIRGMLCSRCNTGLGKLGDDIDSVKKVLTYLGA